MSIYFPIWIYDEVEIAWWICLVKIKLFFSILWRIFQVISELLRPLTANWKLSLLPVPEFAMSFRKKKKKEHFKLNFLLIKNKQLVIFCRDAILSFLCPCLTIFLSPFITVFQFYPCIKCISMSIISIVYINYINIKYVSVAQSSYCEFFFIFPCI